MHSWKKRKKEKERKIERERKVARELLLLLNLFNVQKEIFFMERGKKEMRIKEKMRIEKEMK